MFWFFDYGNNYIVTAFKMTFRHADICFLFDRCICYDRFVVIVNSA